MGILKKAVAALYKAYLEKPLVGLLLFALIGAGALYQAQNFYYDASADTLVAENDPDLLYYREVSEHFSGAGFLFLTYTPKNVPLLSRETVQKLSILTKKLRSISGVYAVSSILDAPLFRSPPVPLSEIATGYRTLQSLDVDFSAAKKELTSSPLFKNLLISEDGNTTAVRIDLTENHMLNALLKKRTELKNLKKPTPKQKEDLAIVTEQYRTTYAKSIQNLELVLSKIRTIRNDILPDAMSYLGGVPMIASDMMQYVKSDLIVFGIGSLLLMMIMLFVFFRQVRWVVLPVLTTSMVLLLIIGLLGILHKPVTVISSNFVSLITILSISIAVHLITKYRGYIEEFPTLPHADIIQKTMVSKMAPCLYTTLTTMAGFASLYASSIVPVRDFGWLMVVGIAISFAVFYLFFPVALSFLPRSVLRSSSRDTRTPLVRLSYHLAAYKAHFVLGMTVILIALTGLGISQLSLDNRFIDYFKKNTEIRKGLAFIDKNLGGTVPMDIIVSFPPYEPINIFEDDFAEDPFASTEVDTFPERYWYTPDKIALLNKLHTFLEARPEIGKIISLATLEEIAQTFNDNKSLNAVEMVATLSKIPEEVRDEFITPYAVPSAGLMRISTRIHETGPLFSRDKLIKDIQSFADSTPELKGRVKVTGMNVLFNGMLRELLASQTSTLFFVVLATFIMFMVLLKSSSLALIGVLPNVFSAFIILGFMGLVGMPLDMMTITIAAIVIGIGVDDAIHYLHYFHERYTVHGNVDQAVRESHREIGRALYVTSLTVIIGFSVLTSSNFVPTIYFGILSAAAMGLALMANLVLLPTLLLKFYKNKTQIPQTHA